MKPRKFRLLLNSKIVGYEKWYSGKWSEYQEAYEAKPQWLYSTDNKNWFPEYIFHNSKEQFTGSTDKNGKEGYDGELIRASVGTITGVVKWNDFYGAWWVYIKDSEFCPLADSLRTGGYFVGNLHENPELLE